MSIQKAITGSLGAVAGAALAVGKEIETKEEKAEAKKLAEKHEAQKDLEHQKKVELLDARAEALKNEEERKAAVVQTKLEESKIKQEGMKTSQGQQAEINRLKIGQERNKVLLQTEKLELMRQKAKDSLTAARDSKRKGMKAFKISDRLSSLQKKRRR